MSFLRAPIAAIVALAVVLSGCGLFTRSAATVNGSVITEGELERELTWMRAVPAFEDAVIRGAQLDPGAREQLHGEVVAMQLNRLIVFKLITQETARRRLPVTDPDRRQAVTDTVIQMTNLLGDPAAAVEVFNSLPHDFRVALVQRQAAATVLQGSLPSADPTEIQLEAFYEANRELFEQVCARYVLSATEPEGREALARIHDGEDFAAVARDVSTDPHARDTGGDVGCFTRGGVEQTFSDTAFATPLGQVAGPVPSAVGWYVIHVYERRGETFASARHEVAARFAGSGPAVEFQALVQGLLEGARVEVNPRYGKWDREQRRVVAPQ